MNKSTPCPSENRLFAGNNLFGRKFASFERVAQVTVSQRFARSGNPKSTAWHRETACIMQRYGPYQALICSISHHETACFAGRKRPFRKPVWIFMSYGKKNTAARERNIRLIKPISPRSVFYFENLFCQNFLLSELHKYTNPGQYAVIRHARHNDMS